MVLNYPFGTGFMESFAPAGGMRIAPHAQYLFLLLGSGISGVVIYFLFVFLCMWKSLFNVPKNDPHYFIMIGTGGAIMTYFFSAFMIHTILVHGADIALFLLCGISTKHLMMRGQNVKMRRTRLAQTTM